MSTGEATAAAFRHAIEQEDIAAILALCSPDITFNSPIVHKPYRGTDAVALLLSAVMRVFKDFRYTAEYAAPDGHVLRFQTRVGDRDLDGVDMLAFDADGRIIEFTVMVRPYSAATALKDAMAAALGAS